MYLRLYLKFVSMQRGKEITEVAKIAANLECGGLTPLCCSARPGGLPNRFGDLLFKKYTQAR